MHKLILLILLTLCALGVAAQPPRLHAQDRERWLQEIRGYKHEFMTRELDLTKEQQREFFPLYDKMEDEIERINKTTRELEDKAEAADASDQELENSARTIFEQKRAEGQIEMTYFDRFRTILTPRQLVRLKNTERRFTQHLIKNHRRGQGQGGPSKK